MRELSSSYFLFEESGFTKVKVEMKNIKEFVKRESFFLPRKLECIFPPSLLWAVYKDLVQSNYDLRKCRPDKSFRIPAFLNQSV